jgi:hypothetical protein
MATAKGWVVFVPTKPVEFVRLGCGGPPIEGRARVALGCRNVAVYRTGAGGWVATGCGRRADFVCTHTGICALESTSGPPEAPVQEMDAIDIAGFRCIAFASHQNRALSVCSALELAALNLARCPEPAVALTFNASGRPETIGTVPSTCVGSALLSVQPAPEFASIVVRLERR